jgi:hypothetical protein
MASAYQSKLFIAIQRGMRQFKESSQRGWRQVKVAVVWGTQVLLSPFLYFADRGRQFGSAHQNNTSLPSSTESGSPDLENNLPSRSSAAIPPTIAVERALAIVAAEGFPIVSVDNDPTGNLAPTGAISLRERFANDWSAIDDSEWQTAYLNPAAKSLVIAAETPIVATAATRSPERLAISPQERFANEADYIQGIASDRFTRELVLVTKSSRILTNLTAIQRQKLAAAVYGSLGEVPTIGKLPVNRQKAATLATSLPTPSPSLWQRLFSPKPLTPVANTPDSPTLAATQDRLALPPTNPLDYSVDRNLPATTIEDPVSAWYRRWRQYWRVDLASTTSDLTQIDRQIAKSSLTSSASKIPTAAITYPRTIDPTNVNSAADVSDSDWFDTNYATVGYERTWWQQLLTILDNIAYTIESWLSQAWQSLTRRFLP